MRSELEFKVQRGFGRRPASRRRGALWLGASVVAMLAFTVMSAAWAARHEPSKTAAAPASTSLHARAVAALAAARDAFDGRLNDYPTARFEDVHARLVHSVYADDEGHSDKVPWIHRGGLVVVLCGQVNAKNRMGAYIGWSRFAFEPAQTDMVTMYGYESPTRLQHLTNLASEDSLWIVQDDGFDNDEVGLLCGDDPPPAEIDAADLSAALVAQR